MKILLPSKLRRALGVLPLPALLALAGLQGSSVAQAAEPATAEPATAADVWMYLPLDGSLDALKPAEGMRTVHFESAGNKPAEFVPGENGQALRVTDANRAQLSLDHGIANWPLQQGSLVIWFRPQNDLKTTSSFWLLMGGWASFDIHAEGGRLIFYDTANSRQFLIGELKAQEGDWQGKWHCAVAVWDGGKRTLYFDGKSVGTADDVEALTSPPSTLGIGYLPQPPGKPATGFLQGDIDEVAILKVALEPAQVTTLFERGKAGLLAALGGDVLGSLPRRAYVRGEKTTLKIQPYANGDTLRVAAVPMDGAAPVALATLPCKVAELPLDTAELRPGRYRLRLEVLKAGKVVVGNELLTLAINAQRAPEFPVGIDGISGYPDSLLEVMQQWHVGLTGNGGFYSNDGFYRDIDRLYFYGISTQPCLNVHYHRAWIPYLKNPELYFNDEGRGTGGQGAIDNLLQGISYADGTYYSSSIGSPFSVAGRQAMKARVADVLKASNNHPGLHSMAFDDEYDLRIGSTDGKRWYGDYGPQAVAYFKEKTGLKAAVYPPTDPPGTIFKDDLPYFKWRDTIGMPGDATNTGLDMNNAEQGAIIHKLRPDVLTTTWSGGEHGESDAVMDYTYPTIWQPGPGYECGQARLDYMFDRHRARQRVKPLKPVWGLTGWWSSNLQGKPDWCVQDFRLSTIMTLAKGARLVLWFTTFPTADTPPGQLGAGLLSRTDLANETHRWADWIHDYGGMFARLEARPARRVAVLLSDANRVGQIHLTNMPVAFDRFYPSMRTAGLDVDLITDRQVMDGTLDQYQALCLFGIQYSSASLWQKIGAFAATPGKVVICDQSTDPALRPAGAKTVALNVFHDQPTLPGKSWMETIVATAAANAALTRTQIVPLLKPDPLQVTGSDLVAPHWLYGGSGRLLSLVNYNLYGPESVAVALHGVGGAVYDLNTQKLVTEAPAGAALSWQADGIEKAGWAPYLIVPQKIGTVGVAARLAEDEFKVAVSTRDDDKALIKAPIPLHIEFMDADGKAVSAYETYTATDAATGMAQVIIPRSKLMDTPGNWTVKVTEMAGGNTATVHLQV